MHEKDRENAVAVPGMHAMPWLTSSGLLTLSSVYSSASGSRKTSMNSPSCMHTHLQGDVGVPLKAARSLPVLAALANPVHRLCRLQPCFNGGQWSMRGKHSAAASAAAYPEFGHEQLCRMQQRHAQRQARLSMYRQHGSSRLRGNALQAWPAGRCWLLSRHRPQ